MGGNRLSNASAFALVTPAPRLLYVWCADITDIPMRRGFVYLIAIVDTSRSSARPEPAPR